MSLAVDNIRLLTLTARKADCEYNISIDSMKKMELTREQTDLSQQYYAKLQGKNITYYANGQYNAMTYSYLMGDAATATYVGGLSDNAAFKKDNSMVLADSNGLIVMSDYYANILKSVLGSDCIDSNGRGGTFSMDKIPAMIAKVSGVYSEDEINQVLQGNGGVNYAYDVNTLKTMSQTSTGSSTNIGSNDDIIQRIIDFYYPIFQSAAANGWTTEYNRDMGNTSNYISDALVSGIFQLQQIDSSGNYKPDASLTYFITSGLVVEKTDSSVREEITAWYNAEKEKINEQESWLDWDISNLSTELEAINTEMKTLEEMLSNDMESLNWCNG